MMFLAQDAYVGRSLDLYGEFSEAEVDLFRQIVRPGQWVIDVGANVGAHTLFFARQVGPSGRVYAFEPQRVVFQMLCANLASNGVLNAWCFPQAVGKAAGIAIVPSLDYASANNFGGVSLEPRDAAGEPVAVVTIDSLQLPRCDFIKVDVEGMEAEVLRGAAETIVRFQPVLYVENDRAERSDELVRVIDGLGYVAYWHFPPLFNPQNFTKNAENVFGTIVSGNILAVPRNANVHLDGFRPVLLPDATNK